MAANEIQQERFYREQSFFLKHRGQLFKGWPHVKQVVATAYYLRESGDRRKQPVGDFGLLLNHMVPEQRESRYWQEQYRRLARKFPGATEKFLREELDKQIFAMLSSYWHSVPAEIRIRMKWWEEDRRAGITCSNSLLPRKIGELKKLRASGIRSQKEIQAVGAKGLDKIRGIGQITANKIVTAVGPRPRSKKFKQLDLDFGED